MILILMLLGWNSFAEERPFFGELQLHAGGVYAIDRGLAPTVGGSYTSGIEGKKIGFEWPFGVHYAPRYFLGSVSAADDFLSIDVGFRVRIISNKMVYKLGPMLAFTSSLNPSLPSGDIGVGPSLGMVYASNRGDRLYAGYGLEAFFLITQNGVTPAASNGFIVGAVLVLYIGYRLTWMEQLWMRIWRR